MLHTHRIYPRGREGKFREWMPTGGVGNLGWWKHVGRGDGGGGEGGGPRRRCYGDGGGGGAQSGGGGAQSGGGGEVLFIEITGIIHRKLRVIMYVFFPPRGTVSVVREIHSSAINRVISMNNNH